MLCDEARNGAFQAWAMLIKCARTGASERNQPPNLAKELLATFLQKTCVAMQQDDDPETLRDAADGIAECLKNVGPGVLQGQEVSLLVQQLLSFVDKSFVRSSEVEKQKQDAEM